MKPPAPQQLLERASEWGSLSRWERSEVGRALRRLGWTYSEIMEVIPVVKGTLSYWCSEIRLSETQILALKARAYPGSRTDIPVDTQRKRHQEIERIQEEARAFARTRLFDPFWVAGTCLYWAEGAKTQRSLSMVNSDPVVLKVFMSWVRKFHDQDSRFVLSLHLHEGNDERAAKRYWADALGLREPEFYKTFIKPKGTGHRKNHLPHGVCRVLVRRSTDAWFRTMAWIEVLAPALPEMERNRGLANLAGGPLAQLGRAGRS